MSSNSLPSPATRRQNDAASINTEFAIFYKDGDSSQSSPLPKFRSYKDCPLALEERVSLLGDSSSTVGERATPRHNGTLGVPHLANGAEEKCEDSRSPNGSSSSRGVINDGTLPTRVVPNEAHSEEEQEEAENEVEDDTEPSIKRCNKLTKGESGCRVNEAIIDDDSMGDKTAKREVRSLPPNGDSKSLHTLFSNGVLTSEPPLPTSNEEGELPVDHKSNLEKAQVGNVPFKGRYSRQFFAAFAANFGAVALGTVLSWTSPALPDLRERKTLGEISTEDETWISAIALLGAASACPIVGFGIERFGRKRCLLLLSAPFLVGWLLITLAQNIWMIYVGRFLSGFCGGGGSIAIPVYVTESASANIRGMLASGFDMMITVGILYIFVVGTFVSWEWQAVACGAIPIVFHFLLLAVPESPRYLVEQGKHSDASNALQWLRGATSSQQVEVELQELTASVADSKSKSATWRDLLETSALKPTALAVGLMVFQQLAAIDAVMFYTVDIFASSGADLNENLSANIVGAIQVLATITAAIVVDRGGRRLLLLVSEVFMVISLGAMGLFFYLKKENNDVTPENLSWLPLVSLMVYVVAFSVGMGPLPWLLMGELLPPHVKGLASGIVTITRWILGFGVTFLFQFLMKNIGPHGCYWVFCGCCVVGGIFILFLVPETRNLSMDEIQEKYFQKRKLSDKPNSNNEQRNGNGVLT